MLNKRNKAHNKARDAANESIKANRRAKTNFYDSVNNTLRNSALSPKKKFSVLFKLMKNNKISNVSPLIEIIQLFWILWKKVTFLINFLHPNQPFKTLMTLCLLYRERKVLAL